MATTKYEAKCRKCDYHIVGSLALVKGHARYHATSQEHTVSVTKGVSK